MSNTIRIAPSKMAILQLSKESLLKFNALIFHKACSLSSSQRKMIQERVAYGINKGTIKPSEVQDEINALTALVKQELENNLNDNSSNQQK